MFPWEKDHGGENGTWSVSIHFFKRERLAQRKRHVLVLYQSDSSRAALEVV